MDLTREEILKRSIADEACELTGLLVDHKKLVVAALLCQSGSVFKKKFSIGWDRISHITKDTIRVEPSDTKDAKSADLERFGPLVDAAVMTARKRTLGKVVTFKVESGTGQITALWVKTPIKLRGLWRQTLVVARSQIVSARPGLVIVDDEIVLSALAPATTSQFMQSDPEPVLGSEIE